MQRIPYEITLSKARNQVGASFFFFLTCAFFFSFSLSFFVFVLWWVFGSETLKFSVFSHKSSVCNEYALPKEKKRFPPSPPSFTCDAIGE